MELICRATLESIVRERFGSKPLRIFRLLSLKQHLEQKQVSDMALVPNKEAKEILYSLLSENFISLQEIPRSTDYAPSRTFYLFSVNLQQVARMVLQRCYKVCVLWCVCVCVCVCVCSVESNCLFFFDRH